MVTCADIDPLLTPFVDDEIDGAGRAAVEAHLAACPTCAQHAVAERSTRQLLRSRAGALSVPAPPALHARCAAAADSGSGVPSSVGGPGPWRKVRRWVPISVAASLIVGVLGLLVFGLGTPVEATLAAQVTLDHAKCFALGDPAPSLTTSRAVEASLAADYGWHMKVPAGSEAEGLQLLGVRRCLSSEGRMAHVMYRQKGRPVSLFVVPEVTRQAGVFDIIGHETILWSRAGTTYALVGDSSPSEMQDLAAYCAKGLE